MKGLPHLTSNSWKSSLRKHRALSGQKVGCSDDVMRIMVANFQFCDNFYTLVGPKWISSKDFGRILQENGNPPKTLPENGNPPRTLPEMEILLKHGIAC